MQKDVNEKNFTDLLIKYWLIKMNILSKKNNLAKLTKENTYIK